MERRPTAPKPAPAPKPEPKPRPPQLGHADAWFLDFGTDGEGKPSYGAENVP